MKATNFELKDPCLMLWDTKREKEIDLAPSYPYDPLAEGECLVPTNYKHDGLEIGDIIYFTHDTGLWIWIVEAYNKLANE